MPLRLRNRLISEVTERGRHALLHQIQFHWAIAQLKQGVQIEQEIVNSLWFLAPATKQSPLSQ
jgi:hypothetical protein